MAKKRPKKLKELEKKAEKKPQFYKITIIFVILFIMLTSTLFLPWYQDKIEIKDKNYTEIINWYFIKTEHGINDNGTLKNFTVHYDEGFKAHGVKSVFQKTLALAIIALILIFSTIVLEILKLKGRDLERYNRFIRIIALLIIIIIWWYFSGIFPKAVAGDATYLPWLNHHENIDAPNAVVLQEGGKIGSWYPVYSWHISFCAVLLAVYTLAYRVTRWADRVSNELMRRMQEIRKQ